MKTYALLLIFIYALAENAHSQSVVNGPEIQIAHELEESLSLAILDNDVDALDRLWADNFTVNNPANQVIRGKETVLDRVRSGIIQYDSYDQEIESVLVLDNMLIVMGKETISPTGNAPGAGQIIERRYTNFWVSHEDSWLLTARHANIICNQ